MGETSKDVLALLTQLMPGFLTAWVVYGFTTYTKPGQFERIVQALIFSFIVNAIVAGIERIALFVGKFHALGIWDKSTHLIVSSVVALALGLALAYYMTNDGFFKLARRLKLTNRTVYPTEWYGAFATQPSYVVLHLSGSRRILGYPAEWPTEPSSGHFRLVNAAWIGDDNAEIPLDRDESILIEAKQVEMVEFLKPEEAAPIGTESSDPTTTAAD